VSGDRTRIAQVLTNLMANAIKFTERNGEITVSVQHHVADQEVEIRVQDTGIGIDRDLLSRIFEPFTQSDRSLDRSRGGLGLGLAVVRALIGLHGGTVGVHSDGPGKGSTFWVRLPTIADSAPAVKQRPASIDTARTRILIVEDNRDAADMLKEVLVERGHEVDVRYSGEDAMSAVREFQPDIVLCDLGLPGKDGYAVATEIRQTSAGREIKLVAISGYGMAEDRERSKAAGFDRHLTKPVEVRKLEKLLAELNGA
jgi:CheY-like chemotaxis protein